MGIAMGTKMGSGQSTQLDKEESKEIAKNTGFTNSQVNNLYKRFNELDKQDKGYLSREDILLIPEFNLNPLAIRIIGIFVPGDEGKCSFYHFCNILAHFQPTRENTPDSMPNSAVSKIRLVFRLFDMSNNGTISKQEILEILRFMLGDHIDAQNLSAIADRVMMEANRKNLDETLFSNDPNLTFETFKVALNSSVVESKMSVNFK